MRMIRVPVMRLQALADRRLSEARALKLEGRLEDLQVWELKRVKGTRKGAKAYTYWIDSCRGGRR